MTPKSENVESIVDQFSAYRVGQQDGIDGREHLSSVLIAAEQLALNDSYCQGYAKGVNIRE